jgi:CRISPR/Cas system-associated exonuclease Cas4 (RecB family)
MDIVQKIDDAYANRDEPVRSYIGASIVGNTCTAFLAFSLRGFPESPAPPNVRRIFQLGHKIEAIVIADLKKAGLFVQENDPLTGKQWEWNMHGGHVSSHGDGIVDIDGEPVLLEVKSMNDASWAKFFTSGVRVSHRHYYDQMQFMMGKSGIKRAMFIAYNKNNSKYHVEFVAADKMEYHGLMANVHLAMAGEGTKIAKDMTDWRCRSCFKRDACWFGQKVEEICRTCANSAPTDDGGWHCNAHAHPVQPKSTCPEWRRYTPKDKP